MATNEFHLTQFIVAIMSDQHQSLRGIMIRSSMVLANLLLWMQHTQLPNVAIAQSSVYLDRPEAP